MRNINTIVLHHSCTPQSWPMQKTIDVINEEHKKLHPVNSSIGLRISYHFLLFPDGSVKSTRPINEIGYHAGNFAVNVVSIGLCLIGNFENDKPTEKQTSALKRLLESLTKQYGISKSNIKLHKEVRLQPTACPGKNITHAYIDKLLEHKPSIRHRMLRRMRLLRLRKLRNNH